VVEEPAKPEVQEEKQPEPKPKKPAHLAALDSPLTER
jgi:hypothetical protein